MGLIWMPGDDLIEPEPEPLPEDLEGMSIEEFTAEVYLAILANRGINRDNRLHSARRRDRAGVRGW